MRVLIFLVLSLSVTGSLAQDNYGFEEAFIMTKQGDSIKGFVEVAPSYGSKIGFKKEVNDAQTFIPTKEIKFILTPKRYLENVPLGKKESLMTMVVDGRARLFLQIVSHVVVPQSSASHYEARATPYETNIPQFVVKMGATYTEVKKKQYQEILSALLFACPEVVQKLRENAFTYEETSSAVMYYNSCK